MKIYSQELEPDVYNLIHVHLPSESHFSTVETFYINEKDDFNNFLKCESDPDEENKKYRLIIQKNHVCCIACHFKGKIQEIQFEEHSFAIGEIIDIEQLSIPPVKYGKIVGISQNTVLSIKIEKNNQYEKGKAQEGELFAQCKDSFTKELNGSLQLELIPDIDKKPEETKIITISPCFCKNDPTAKAKVEEIEKKWKNAYEQDILSIVKTTKEALELYRTKGKDMKIEELQNIQVKLQTADGSLITIPESLSLDEEFLVFLI